MGNDQTSGKKDCGATSGQSLFANISDEIDVILTSFNPLQNVAEFIAIPIHNQEKNMNLPVLESNSLGSYQLVNAVGKQPLFSKQLIDVQATSHAPSQSQPSEVYTLQQMRISF